MENTINRTSKNIKERKEMIHKCFRTDLVGISGVPKAHVGNSKESKSSLIFLVILETTAPITGVDLMEICGNFGGHYS